MRLSPLLLLFSFLAGSAAKVQQPIYLNCGGGTVTGDDGNQWLDDSPFASGGNAASDYSTAVQGTTNDIIYQSYRWFGRWLSTAEYNIPELANGLYTVRLHFAEHHFNSATKRIFNVIVQEVADAEPLDIFAEAGGAYTAMVRTYENVEARDGNLKIQLAPGTANNPAISAIEIIPEGTTTSQPSPLPEPTSFEPIFINCGWDQDFTDTDGNVWKADQYFQDNGAFHRAWGSCLRNDTIVDKYLCTERYWSTARGHVPPFVYKIPVPNGPVKVDLIFAEIYYGSSEMRFFDVKLQDTVVAERLDVYSMTGGQNLPYILNKQVTVYDGFLTVELINLSGGGNPKISAIFVSPISSAPSTRAPITATTPAPVAPPVAPPVSAPTDFNLDGTWEIFEDQDIYARHEACFVMAGNKAFLMGGRETQDVDIFDPASGSWSKGAKAPIKLHHTQCVSVEGKIYFPAAWTGGYPQEDTLDVMWIYDTVANNWYSEDAMPLYRRRGSAAIIGDGTKLWISHGNIGGHEKDEFATSYGYIDYYDTVEKVWHMGDIEGFPDAPNPRDHTGGALVNGRICVSGGRNGGLNKWPSVAPTDCFDPATKTWSVEADIPVSRSGSSYGTTCDGRLIIAGGERSLESRVDVFNGKTWETFANGLNVARHGSGLAVDCERNKIYIASGSPNGGGGRVYSLEVYTPA